MPRFLKSLHLVGLALLSLLLPAALLAEEKADSLPRALLIGDSISGGYTKTVIRELAGKVEVSRIPGNGEWTGTGIKNIDAWLGDGKWDVIHFNWGLWDIYGWQYAKEDRSTEEYAKRLDTLVTRMEKTGAKLIWATTTPVCPVPEKTMLAKFKTEVLISPELEKQYRDAALAVMEKHNVQINDLHTFIKPHMAKLSPDPANVHFNGGGNGRLAGEVSKAILLALGMQPAEKE
jgi:acyl-CoA thioesterase-1